MRAEADRSEQIRYRGWLLGTLLEWGERGLITPAQVEALAAELRSELRALEAGAPVSRAAGAGALDAEVLDRAAGAVPPDMAELAGAAGARLLDGGLPGAEGAASARLSELADPADTRLPDLADSTDTRLPDLADPASARLPDLADPASARLPDGGLAGGAAAGPVLARPYPLPEPPPRAARPDTLSVIGGLLRTRIGWVVGVVLTVIGSFYLAGTVWQGLSAGWRQVMVMGFLGAYAAAFTKLGLRLGRIPGAETARRWVLGLAVALLPIQAMAAAGLWALGGLRAAAAVSGSLAAIAALGRWLLGRALPALEEDPRRRAVAGHTFLLLSLGVGLVPLSSGPGWLATPILIAAVGAWAAVTRSRGLGWVTGGLLACGVGVHAALAPVGPAHAYAPLLMLSALVLLYLDTALGRWRALHRVRLQSWRGVIAAALAAAALGLVATRCAPLPLGAGSAVTGALGCGFFLGAALAWRRPGLLYLSLLSALIATLALPDLARAVAEPLAGAASQSLGYGGEPLPLAWYSLTLLPYLAACLWCAGRIRETPWRQAGALAATALRWTGGLSLLLLALAHTRGGDLRPALLALPLHAALWLRRRSSRTLGGGVLPWAMLLLWSADLWLQSLAPGPGLALLAGLLLTLPRLGAIAAARLLQPALRDGAQRAAALAAPALPTLAAASGAPHWLLGLALVAWGLVWWRVERGALPAALAAALPPPALPALAAGIGVLGLATIAVALKLGALPAASAASALAVAAALLARRVDPPRRAALRGWARALAAAAVLLSLGLDGAARALVRLPVGGLLLYWMWGSSEGRGRARHLPEGYGGLLLLGLAEGAVRRLLGAGLEPGAAALLGALVVWSPVPLARRLPHRVRRGLIRPAWWLAFAGGLAAAVLLAGTGVRAPGQAAAGAALVGWALACSRLVAAGGGRGSRLLSEVIEGLAYLVALALAAAAAPRWPQALGALALALAGLSRLVPARGAALAVRDRAALLAGALALVFGAVLGPLGAGFSACLAAAGVLMIRGTRGEEGWIEAGAAAATAAAWLSAAASLGLPGLSSAAALRGWAPLVWPGTAGPLGSLDGPEVYLLIGLGAAAAAAAGARRGAPWRRSLSRFGAALGLPLTAAWALWSLLLLAGHALRWQPAALAAAGGLLLAHTRGRGIAGLVGRAALAGAAALAVPALGLPGSLVPWILLGLGAAVLEVRAEESRCVQGLAALTAAGMVPVLLVQPAPAVPLAPAWLAAGWLLVRAGRGPGYGWVGLAAALTAAGLRLARAAPGPEGAAALVALAWAAPALAALSALAAAASWRRSWAPGAIAALALLGLGALGLPGGAVFGLLVLGAAAAVGLARRGGWRLEAGTGAAGAGAAGLASLGAALAALLAGGSLGAASLPPLILTLAAPALAAAGLGVEWLWLLALPALAWVPVEGLGMAARLVWPASLALLSLALTAAERAGISVSRRAAPLCLWLAAGAGLAGALGASSAGVLAIHAGLIAAGFGLRRQGRPALAAGWLALCAAVFAAPLPAAWCMPLTLGAAALARRQGWRWLSRAWRAGLLPAATLGGLLLSVDLALATLGAGLAWEVALTLRQERPARWWWTLSWGAGLLAVAAGSEPLSSLPAGGWLPLLVSVGGLLELSRVAVARARTSALAAPLGQAAVLLAAFGLGVAAALGALAAGGLAYAGCLFALRYVLGGRRRALLAAAALLDASWVALALERGWADPLATVAPLSLSAMVVAQRLRGTTDPRVIAMTRYLAAGALYLTAFAQVVADPVRALVMLLLALAGIFAGSLLRVRAYLYLGAGFAAATLVTNLLRFGFRHSQFWALYLTLIGLSVLAVMIVTTVQRERILVTRARLRAALGEWE